MLSVSQRLSYCRNLLRLKRKYGFQFQNKNFFVRNNICQLTRCFSTKEKCDNYALAVSDCNVIDTAFASRMFEVLKLSSFSDKEIQRAFDDVDKEKNGYVERKEILEVLRNMKFKAKEGKLVHTLDDAVDILMASFDVNRDGKISFEEFKSRILFLAERRDKRVWPISGSMLIVGISVGVMLPVMPQLVTQLGLTSADYGYVVSAFALSKLCGNIPAAFGVEKYGRKPMLILGVSLLGVSMFGFSNSTCVEHLIAARMIGGLGVAAFSSAATMSITDISTSVNRARMMAPFIASFSAGSLLGPAIGGPLVSLFGPSNTFYFVGGIFLLNGLFIRQFISETLPPWRNKFADSHRTLSQEFVTTLKEWGPLMKQKELRDVCILNGAYWFSLSGASMTLLPLILVSDRFGFTPMEVGGVFAFQSAISVIFTPIAANLIDKYGAKAVMPISMMTVSLAAGSFPFATNTYEALAVLGMWSLGGTMLGSAPSTFTANISAPEHRAQSLALLRTAGDFGMLTGAASVGSIAVLTSPDTAMQISAGFLFLVNGWFFARMRKPQPPLSESK